MSNETKTAAVQPAAPAKEKKPSVVDTFLKGCARGFKVGIENITPAMILGYVLVYILQETGLMDLLGIKGNRTSSVALIQNARSHKAESGRKDIIKVEGDASWLNLDVLAYLDPDISVTVIENGKAVKKEKPQPPKRLVNIVRCKNPRCISSIEEECDQIFELSSNGKYRCIYCEQELQVKPE